MIMRQQPLSPLPSASSLTHGHRLPCRSISIRRVSCRVKGQSASLGSTSLLSSKKKRCFRVHKVCRAVPPGNDNDNDSLQLPIVPFVTSPVYLAAQAAVVVGLSAAIDAGWSGDWSRIEVITTEDEATVRNVVQQVLTFHLVCTPVAFLAAKAKGNDTTKATLKTLLIGGLACFEAVLSPPQE